MVAVCSVKYQLSAAQWNLKKSLAAAILLLFLKLRWLRRLFQINIASRPSQIQFLGFFWKSLGWETLAVEESGSKLTKELKQPLHIFPCLRRRLQEKKRFLLRIVLAHLKFVMQEFDVDLTLSEIVRLEERSFLLAASAIRMLGLALLLSSLTHSFAFSKESCIA